MINNYTNYTQVAINVERVKSLSKLIRACKKEGVEINKVFFYQNGFTVTFNGVNGDAILHDNSYGREDYSWETIGMPWDYGDVSVHTAKELAMLLGQLKRGEWKEEE